MHRPTGVSDRTIQSVDLQACFDGDAAAWTQFVEQAMGLVMGAVRRTVGTPPPGIDLEDLAQQVFVRLLQHDCRLLRTYDPARSKLSTWLTMVSRSATIDVLRRKRLSTVHVDAALSIPVDDEAPEVRESALANIPTEVLTARQVVILRLLYDDGLDVAEVAQVLGVEAQTIRSSRHKAMVRLRAHMEGCECEQ